MASSSTAPDPAAPPSARTSLAKLLDLAQLLRVQGRHDDAITLFEHLADIHPDPAAVQLGWVRALGAQGRTLEALERLIAVRALVEDPQSLISDIREQTLPAAAKFNRHLAAGELEEAEKYAAAVVALLPLWGAMLRAAFSCNRALGRPDATARYASALLSVEPEHLAARTALADHFQALGDVAAEIEHRMHLALAPDNDLHPLVRLRDIHTAISLILCHPLTESAEAQLRVLLAAAGALVVETEPGSEWEAWATHYRVLLESIDLDATLGPTPKAAPEPPIDFATSTGGPLDWAGVQAAADRLGAQAVFFAAGDENYVQLYARWYGLSVLKYCDVPCLVVVHVIGGAGRLAEIAQAVGISDARLVFAGCGFDAAAVTTRCYDAPPKGLSALPLAHFQCVRFQRLGALMDRLKRPVFVSDIDLLLQRGVADLLERSAGADVVFNENEASLNAGSRLTANLLLLNPTPNAALMLRFLRDYLTRMLARPEVTRWIDQAGLLLAWRHLAARGKKVRVDRFDTQADINNVMYTTYQEHPFRFLSLYHGFDTSSLERDPRVLGEAG